MIKLSLFLTVPYLFLISLFSYGQTKEGDYREEGWVMYERGFEFKKGVYLSFEEFKNNSPSVQQEFEKRESEIYVMNDSLNKWMPLKKSTWGYSNGRNIFIKAYYDYTRIGIIGELSYLAITSGGMPGASVALSSMGGIGIGLRSPSNVSAEYLLDFITGGFVPFTKNNFESILKERDPMLFEQYRKAKGKKKEKMHLFLNAYNDSHPIYFPE